MSVSFESAPPASFASPIAAIDNPWLAPAAAVTAHQTQPRYMNNVPIIAPPSPKPTIMSTTGPSNRTAAMLWADRRRNALVPLELLPPVPRNALVTSVRMVHIPHSRSNSRDGKDAKDNGIVLINPFASTTEDKTSNNNNNNTVNNTNNSSGEQTPTSPASPTTPTRQSTSPTSPTSQQVSFFFSPAPNKRPRLGRRRSSCTQTQQRSPPLSPSACSTPQSCATSARNVTYFPRVTLTQVTSSVNNNTNAGVETPQETKAESEREPKQDSKMIIDTTPSITDTTSPIKESPLSDPQQEEPLPSYTASLMASDPRREQRSSFVVTVRLANSTSSEEQPPSYVSSYFSGTAKASTDPLQAARKLKQDQLENDEATAEQQRQQSSSPASSPWFVPSNALSPPPAPRLKHRPLTLPLSLRKPRFLSLQARQAPLPPLPNANNPYAYPAHVRSRAEGNQALPPSEILRLKRPFNVLPPGIIVHQQQQRIAPPPTRLPAPKPAWNKPLMSSNLATCAPIVPASAMEVEEDDEDLSMEMALSGGLEEGVYLPGTLLPSFPGSPANPSLLYTSNRLPSRTSSLSRSSTQIAKTPSPSPAPVRPRQKKGKGGKTGSRVGMLRWAILNHSGPEVGRRILGMGVRLAQEIWEAEQVMDEEDMHIVDNSTSNEHREPQLQLSNVRFRSRRRVSLPDEDQHEDEHVPKEDDVMDVKEERSFLLTTNTTEEHPMQDVSAAADNNKAVVDDEMDMEGRDAVVPLSEHAPVLRAVPEVQEDHHWAPVAAPVEEKELMATAIPENSQDGLMSYEERVRLADECIRELEEQMEIDDDNTPEEPPLSTLVVDEKDEDVDMLDAAAIPDAPIAPEGVHPPTIEVERDPPLPETTPEATVMDPEPAAQREEEEPLLPVNTRSPSSLDFIASLPIARDHDRDLFGLDLPMDLDPDPLRRHPLSESSRIRLHLNYNGPTTIPSSSSLPRKRNGRLSHLATISSSMASFSITKRWFERMYL